MTQVTTELGATFEKEVTFLDPANFDAETNGFTTAPVTKVVKFKELNRIDKDQHKLHFKLMAIFESNPEKEGQMDIDSDKTYDLTVQAVKTLAVIDDNFTEKDKTQFLQDSGALLNFGLWLLGAKITPFFSTLMQK